jgi:hypothetical protein
MSQVMAGKTTPKSTPPKKKGGPPRRVDAKKLTTLVEKGVKVVDAAKACECSERQAYRILDQFGIESRALEDYKSNRADAFAGIQKKALSVASKVLESMDSREQIEALQPHQKTGLLTTTITAVGILNDKERLERGQSTSNVQSLLLVASKKADDLDRV